jgi:hypothetical protein
MFYVSLNGLLKKFEVELFGNLFVLNTNMRIREKMHIYMLYIKINFVAMEAVRITKKYSYNDIKQSIKSS